MIPTWLTPRLIAGAVGLIAIGAFLWIANGWRTERNDLLAWQGNVVMATTEAIDIRDPKTGALLPTKPKDVAAHIRNLGIAIKDVRLKTAQAQAQDLADARAVERQNSLISQEISNDYQERLAAARATAERLRRDLDAATAHQGRGGNAGVSRPADAPSRPSGAGAQDGFSLADRLIATEQAIQLDALIRFYKKTAPIAVATAPNNTVTKQ